MVQVVRQSFLVSKVICTFFCTFQFFVKLILNQMSRRQLLIILQREIETFLSLLIIETFLSLQIIETFLSLLIIETFLSLQIIETIVSLLIIETFLSLQIIETIVYLLIIVVWSTPK